MFSSLLLTSRLGRLRSFGGIQNWKISYVESDYVIIEGYINERGNSR